MTSRYKRLLSNILHKIRLSKPAQVVAQETAIPDNQLSKYRAEGCADYRPHVDEHERLVRCIYEVSPEQAQSLAQAAIPSELFRVVPLTANPDGLMSETIQLSAAAGRVPDLIQRSMADGVLDSDEREELRQALDGIERETADYRAALEKMENK